jgi:hypothetical protein
MVLLCCSCGTTFDPPSDINSVRILAIQANPPYALPGTTVQLQILAFDGRQVQTEPMTVAWFPQACFDPPDEAYFACYAALPQLFTPGENVTSLLTPGPSFSFQMPADVITDHSSTLTSDPYGVGLVFAVACAGQVRYTGVATSNISANPFGCFDSNGVALDANSFVLAYGLVYSFTDRTNANPVITNLTFAGNPVDPVAGITVTHCTSSTAARCPTTPIDTVVPPSSQELDPGSLDANGNPLKEEIWVDYYASGGTLGSGTVILYSPTTGQVQPSPTNYAAPPVAGEFLLWAVVHDDRGGVSWLQVPVHVQ